MKKFWAGFITAVALSFFVFPVEFTFLPSALNSKMIMAGWGIVVFLYRCIRERRVEIPRIIFISGLLAALFSLWCLIAVTLTETYNMEYVSYIKSFLTWVFGALGACAVMKFCTGKDDLPTLTKYLAIVCVSQCILALLFDNVPFTVSLANRLFFTGSDFYRSGGRLFGIGCALDVAGVRFSAILLLVAHQIATNAQLGEKNLSIVTMLLVFLITTLVGAMISRTTVVGAALGLAYMAVANMKVMRGGYVSSRQVRVFLVGVVTLLVAGALAVYLYQSSQMFYENVRFGFEGFFNWVETGEFRTGSTDHLQTMWVWPTTPRGWWIGEGIVGVFQTNSDIGYCNFILYCGLIGMVIYSLYYIYNHLCLNEKYNHFLLMSLLMVALTFIIWAKVQTDSFFMDALLFCASGDVKFYRR